MPLIPIKQTLIDVRRLRKVAAVFFEEGLSFMIDRARLRYAVPFFAKVRRHVRGLAGEGSPLFGRDAGPPMEVRFRRAFERLGPTFVKFGQLLSLRPDLVPPEFVREFAKLQDAVPTLTPGVAEKIVERELGQPFENLFRSFDERPLAAASLAQVHRAVLRDGTRVAVKVRRPGIEDVVATDVRIMLHIAQLLEAHVPEAKKFRPVRAAAEFADWTLREIDFENEAVSIDRFRAVFADDASVVVPRVHWDLTTKGVLVTDLLEGIRIDDVDALKARGIDRREIARTGLRAGFRQFFVEGFFHGDPHPGNFIALPPDREGRPRVGMYDFGIVGLLSERSRFELVSCFLSFLNKDVDAYVKHILDLAESADGADIDGFARDARQIVMGVLYKPTERKGVASAFYHVLLSGARHGVAFPGDLVLLGKAFLTLESIGLVLYPEIDLAEEMRPFLSDVLARELRPAKIAADAKAAAFDSLYFFKHLPDQTRGLLERLEKGNLGVRIDLKELQDLKSEFDRQNDIRVLAVLAAALVLGSGLALRLDERAEFYGFSLAKIAFLVAMIVVLWLFFLIRKRPRP